ncbi:Hypothetical predicted protein [Pelobates cultripes]|uniref:Uncharacterized protein n=1 Tax=Pelobates cultripes TaxID=61616 RepID=A0AAD1VPK1_PELCU|nr:Hypothetical predicted protein [Pelobates cultripes]
MAPTIKETEDQTDRPLSKGGEAHEKLCGGLNYIHKMFQDGLHKPHTSKRDFPTLHTSTQQPSRRKPTMSPRVSEENPPEPIARRQAKALADKATETLSVNLSGLTNSTSRKTLLAFKHRLYI